MFLVLKLFAMLQFFSLIITEEVSQWSLKSISLLPEKKLGAVTTDTKGVFYTNLNDMSKSSFTMELKGSGSEILNADEYYYFGTSVEKQYILAYKNSYTYYFNKYVQGVSSKNNLLGKIYFEDSPTYIFQISDYKYGIFTKYNYFVFDLSSGAQTKLSISVSQTITAFSHFKEFGFSLSVYDSKIILERYKDDTLSDRQEFGCKTTTSEISNFSIDILTNKTFAFCYSSLTEELVKCIINTPKELKTFSIENAAAIGSQVKVVTADESSYLVAYQGKDLKIVIDKYSEIKLLRKKTKSNKILYTDRFQLVTISNYKDFLVTLYQGKINYFSFYEFSSKNLTIIVEKEMNIGIYAYLNIYQSDVHITFLNSTHQDDITLVYMTDPIIYGLKNFYRIFDTYTFKIPESFPPSFHVSVAYMLDEEINDISYISFIKCHSACSICSDAGTDEKNNCLKCPKNSYRKKEDNPKAFNCYSQKPIGYYLENSLYVKCDEKCEDCESGPKESTPQCTKCKNPEHFIKEGDCVEKCLPPYVPDANKNCVICEDYVLDDTCVETCPTGTEPQADRSCKKCTNFYYGNKCFDKCDPKSIIKDTNPRECLPNTEGSCPKGTFLVKSEDICLSCDGENKYFLKDKCVSLCPIGYRKGYNKQCIYCKGVLYDNQCLEKCPKGTQKDSLQRVCEHCGAQYSFKEKCYSTCPEGYEKKTENGFNYCSKCTNYYYKGNCVEECPKGTTLTNFICDAYEGFYYEGKEVPSCPQGYDYDSVTRICIKEKKITMIDEKYPLNIKHNPIRDLGDEIDEFNNKTKEEKEKIIEELNIDLEDPKDIIRVSQMVYSLPEKDEKYLISLINNIIAKLKTFTLTSPTQDEISTLSLAIYYSTLNSDYIPPEKLIELNEILSDIIVKYPDLMAKNSPDQADVTTITSSTLAKVTSITNEKVLKKAKLEDFNQTAFTENPVYRYKNSMIVKPENLEVRNAIENQAVSSMKLQPHSKIITDEFNITNDLITNKEFFCGEDFNKTVEEMRKSNISLKICFPSSLLKDYPSVSNINIISYSNYPLLNPNVSDISKEFTSLKLFENETDINELKVSNLSEPIRIFLKKPRHDLNECMFFDEETKKPNSSNCESYNIDDEYIMCSCNHLTDFSLSKYNPVNIFKDVINLFSQIRIMNSFKIFRHLNKENAFTLYVFAGILLLYLILLPLMLYLDISGKDDCFVMVVEKDEACCSKEEVDEEIEELKEKAEEDIKRRRQVLKNFHVNESKEKNQILLKNLNIKIPFDTKEEGEKQVRVSVLEMSTVSNEPEKKESTEEEKTKESEGEKTEEEKNEEKKTEEATEDKKEDSTIKRVSSIEDLGNDDNKSSMLSNLLKDNETEKKEEDAEENKPKKKNIFKFLYKKRGESIHEKPTIENDLEKGKDSELNFHSRPKSTTVYKPKLTNSLLSSVDIEEEDAKKGEGLEAIKEENAKEPTSLSQVSVVDFSDRKTCCYSFFFVNKEFYLNEYRLIALWLNREGIMSRTNYLTLIFIRLAAALSICSLLSVCNSKSQSEEGFTNRDLAVAIATTLIIEIPFTFIEIMLCKTKVPKSKEKEEAPKARTRAIVLHTFIYIFFVLFFAAGTLNTAWIAVDADINNGQCNFMEDFVMNTILDYFVYEVIVITTKSLLYTFLIRTERSSYVKACFISFIATLPWLFAIGG